MALAFVISPIGFGQDATQPAGQPAAAQSATTVREPQTTTRKLLKRTPTQPARVTVVPSDPPALPQVVTIVHRLSGVKLLRLFLRQSGQSGVVETIDPETITKDAHASIIAGLLLDDGKTIAARLPQAAAEVELQGDAWFLNEKMRQPPAAATATFTSRLQPDLTVITGDGKKITARLIGLDAETGLSVLQINEQLPAASPKITNAVASAGQSVDIFAPQPSQPEGEPAARTTYVKVGKINATVAQPDAPNANVSGVLVVRAPRLSLTEVGGVVCDRSGNTIGIVESIDNNVARVVSANTIRTATQRVLDRHASVPRPLLGVRGEPVELAAPATFLTNGWRQDQLTGVLKGQIGILLTSVVPQTPAALAKLQPGDVILRVNQTEVKTAEEFSKLLGEAGSGEQVQFTIVRPDTPSPFSVPVTLGQSFAPTLEWHLELQRATTPFFGLRRWGFETMELDSEAAAGFGAQHGFIVVAVEPDSAAWRGGLREGDVIESVDGRAATAALWVKDPPLARKHTLSIVRDRDKKTVVMED